MKKYDHGLAVCIKCGCGQLKIEFGWWRGHSDSDPSTEIIECTCADCGFSWDMLPLDAKADESDNLVESIHVAFSGKIPETALGVRITHELRDAIRNIIMAKTPRAFSTGRYAYDSKDDSIHMPLIDYIVVCDAYNAWVNSLDAKEDENDCPLDYCYQSSSETVTTPDPVNVTVVVRELWEAVGEIIPENELVSQANVIVNKIGGAVTITYNLYKAICDAYEKLSKEFGDETGEIVDRKA